ncbi:AAA family ATPase [Streptomyces sp. NPDC088725]|uniref:helix-turn-helix transcriptional regulator n=1 Tax=Streptomyces sp. NPDC088725 TaxID=3365873 RepID=UPI00380C3FF3
MPAQIDFRRSSSTLIGHADELGVLNRHATGACAGNVGLVTLSGPAGIGKTTLLRTFLAGDACRDMSVRYGSCAKAVPGAAYGGVRELFGPSASDVLTGPDDLGGERPGAPTVYRTLHRLYRLAVGLMADRPLVLVLDDVHRCDELSLLWVDFLLRRADGLPLLVVLARRDTEPVAPAALADIAARREAAVLRLTPLTREDVGEMTRRFLRATAGPAPARRTTAQPATAGPGSVERRFTEHAAAVSGGNPLTLSRLLGELRAEGVRPDEDGARRITETGGPVVAHSVRALLDCRPPWVKDVAKAIAVLGEESPDLVGVLAGLPPAFVTQGVRVLRHAEVVAPDRDDLVHEMVRSAVLDSIGTDDLVGLRTRAALLLSDAERPPERSACQLMALPAVTEAWMPALLRDAAASAVNRGAPETAARYLRRVLDVDPDSVPVRVELAAALSETDPHQAAGLLEQALSRAGDIRTLAAVAARFGMVCLAVRRSPTGLRVLTEVLDALRAEAGPCPTPADRELLTHVESVLLSVGAAEKATILTVKDHAARLTAPPGDTPAQRQLLAMTTTLTAMDGRSAERTAEQARRVTDFARPGPESWSLITASFALGLADEVGEALDALDRTITHGRENGAVRTHVLALSARALLLHSTGAIPDALADARTSIEIIGEGNRGGGAVLPRTALATVLIDRGEPERAEELLTGIDRAGLDRFVIEYHWYLMVRARARWALGDREAALRLFRDCGASLEEAGFTNPVFLPWWMEAACLLAVMNRPEEAHEHVEYGAGLARRWGTPRALGSAALARGVITPGAAGIELLTEAVLTLAESPARAEHARAEYFLGRALLTTGDQRAAREHLRNAADLGQRCGALWLTGAARELLVTAGGRMRRMSASPLDMLTGMERRVADLAAAGGSNRSIAESLFVTVRTVETHLTSVYRKLGVSRRTELASVLRAPGIPDRHPPNGVSESGRRRSSD